MPKPEEIFYNDLPPAEAKKWADLLVSMSANALSSGVDSAAWNTETYRSKTAYIFTENDNAIPLEGQKMLAGNAGIQRTVSLASSHSPFLSMPKQTAEAIIKFAEEFTH